MDVKNSKTKLLTRRISATRKLDSLNIDHNYKNRFKIRRKMHCLSPRNLPKTDSRRGSDEKGQNQQKIEKIKEQRDFDDLIFDEEENFKEFLFYLSVTIESSGDNTN
jgi:hypothetical protein